MTTGLSSPKVNTAGWHDLEFGAGVSRRYHQKRCVYFERSDTAITIASLLFGSSAFFTVIGQFGETVPAVSAVVIVWLSTVGAIKRYGKIADVHNDLSRKFTVLLHDIAMLDESEKTVETYKEMRSRLRDLEIQEPPHNLYVLSAICFNEEVIARGYYDARLIPLNWFQAMFANMVDVFPSRVQENLKATARADDSLGSE